VPRSRRERDLYKYRPDDVEAQREAARRMTARRKQELGELSKQFDGTIRRKLGEETGPQPPRSAQPTRRRRKRSLVRSFVEMLSSALLGRGRSRRGSHRY
jgi:hypothetical protein